MGTCRHQSFAGLVDQRRSMFTPQHGQMRSEPLAQFKRKRSPTFDSYHVTGLLPTSDSDLPPGRPAVCRSLVEAAAASSYTGIPTVLASPSRVLLPTTIQGIWTLTREMSYLRTVPANTTEQIVSVVGCSWLRTSAADHLIHLCCHGGREFCEQLFHELR